MGVMTTTEQFTDRRCALDGCDKPIPPGPSGKVSPARLYCSEACARKASRLIGRDPNTRIGRPAHDTPRPGRYRRGPPNSWARHGGTPTTAAPGGSGRPAGWRVAATTTRPPACSASSPPRGTPPHRQHAPSASWIRPDSPCTSTRSPGARPRRRRLGRPRRIRVQLRGAPRLVGPDLRPGRVGIPAEAAHPETHGGFLTPVRLLPEGSTGFRLDPSMIVGAASLLSDIGRGSRGFCFGPVEETGRVANPNLLNSFRVGRRGGRRPEVAHRPAIRGSGGVGSSSGWQGVLLRPRGGKTGRVANPNFLNSFRVGRRGGRRPEVAHRPAIRGSGGVGPSSGWCSRRVWWCWVVRTTGMVVVVCSWCRGVVCRRVRARWVVRCRGRVPGRW